MGGGWYYGIETGKEERVRERKAGVNKERQGCFLYLTLHRFRRPHSGKVRTPGPTLCTVMGAGCPAMKGQAGFGPWGSQ